MEKNWLKLDLAAISALTKHLLTSQGALERASFYSPLAYFNSLCKLFSNKLPQMISRIQDNTLAMLQGHLCFRTQFAGVKIKMMAHALMADTMFLEEPISTLTIRKGKEIQRKYWGRKKPTYYMRSHNLYCRKQRRTRKIYTYKESTVIPITFSTLA